MQLPPVGVAEYRSEPPRIDSGEQFDSLPELGELASLAEADRSVEQVGGCLQQLGRGLRRFSGLAPVAGEKKYAQGQCPRLVLPDKQFHLFPGQTAERPCRLGRQLRAEQPLFRDPGSELASQVGETIGTSIAGEFPTLDQREEVFPSRSIAAEVLDQPRAKIWKLTACVCQQPEKGTAPAFRRLDGWGSRRHGT